MSTSGTYQLDGVVFPRNPLTKRWSRQRLAAGGDRRAIHSDLWQLELSFGTLKAEESAFFAGKWYEAGLHVALLPRPKDGLLAVYTGVAIDNYSFSFGDVDHNAWALNPRLIISDINATAVTGTVDILSVFVTGTFNDALYQDGTAPLSALALSGRFGADGAGNPNGGNARFTLPIAQGAIILAAHLEVVADNTEPNPVKGKIQVEIADSAAAILSNGQWEGKTLSSPVLWNPAAWTSGETYQSPSIQPQVQQIVNRGGWASNNAIQFLIEDNGTVIADSLCSFHSWNFASGTSAPRLIVEFYNI